MKILVVGCGGIGGFLGARLTQAGYDVHFVARGETLAVLNQFGLLLRSPFGDITLSHVKASADASTLSEANVVFICVKLWDNESAFRAIQRVVTPQTAILSFQNGVHTVETTTNVFGTSQAIGATCYISARVESTGHILHSGRLQRFIIGEQDGGESERIKRICLALTDAGLDVSVSSDIEKDIWEKFVFLVALSGSTSAMRSPIGPIRETRLTRSFLHGLLRETVAVANARGVALDPGFAESQLSFLDSLPPEMTSSMYADLMNGKRLELPWLSGDVASMGAKLNVPTPLNAAVRDVLCLYSYGANFDATELERAHE